MGIPKMNRLLANHPLSEERSLKNQKLIVDLSNPYRFVKKFIRSGRFDRHVEDIPQFQLTDTDRFGSNLVQLDKLFRSFFLMLKEANITPIVVFAGVCPSETESILGSKVIYMKKSCQIAMKVNSIPHHRNHVTIPQLTVTLIKRIINELEPHIQVLQCAYEVYPMLAHQAALHNCEVLTNHADFIMLDARRGFFKWEDVPMKLNSQRELVVNVYSHLKLLQQFQLWSTGSSLSTLLTLMREDFQGKFHQQLNDLLRLKFKLSFNDGEFIPNSRGFRQGNEYPRLMEVLQKWNSLNFLCPADVRDSLRASDRSNSSLVREFDVVHRTFTEPLLLESQNLIPAIISNHFDITASLCKRESSADFLAFVVCQRKIFNRIGVEDFNTILSTFSLANAARELVMVEAQVRKLELFDRDRSQIQWLTIMQSLDPDTFRRVPNDQRIYRQVFRFPGELIDENHLKQWIESRKAGEGFAAARALDMDTCKELVIVMLLIRYGFEFGFRRRSKLSQLKEQPNSRSASANSTSSRTNQEVADPLSTEYKSMQILLSRAVYNCFLHSTFIGDPQIANSKQDPRVKDRTLITDQLLKDRDFFSNLNILSNELSKPRVRDQVLSYNEKNYVNRKHCIEILNSTMHAYCELNSLFNYPATKLNFNRWFEGNKIYKLMQFEQNHLATNFLMRIDQDLAALINTPF